uniref:Excitatory peptide receptor 1 n=1 Tax=Platynereis dumerilii TaxID=6359 RepID=A0A0K0PUT9_PLADU|nr:excitatory peptide receptor 1 [Platynereis dumerilii]
MATLSSDTSPTASSAATNSGCNLTGSCGNDAAVQTIGMIHNTPEAFVVPIVFALIFIVGVVGNGLLIFIVLHNKNMRNVPNVFIVSLALGDLLLILISVPFTATIYTFTEWPYGEVMCKIIEFLQALSLGVSVFTLTMLSYDRYIAIVDPMKRHRTSSMAVTIGCAIAVWIVSTVLAVLELFGAHIRVRIYNGVELQICEVYPLSWGTWYEKFHVLFRFLVYFAIPVVIIGVFYVLMARILITSSRKMPGASEGRIAQQIKQMEARKKVARVVLSFVIVFCLCWFPRHVYLLWYYFDPADYNMFWHIFKIFGFCMMFINSCVNPLTLYFLSKQFRKYYNRYLLCCCPGSRSRQSEYSTMYNFNSTDRRSSTNMTVMATQTKC